MACYSVEYYVLSLFGVEEYDCEDAGKIFFIVCADGLLGMVIILRKVDTRRQHYLLLYWKFNNEPIKILRQR